MLPQQYCLRWKYHHSNLQTMFSQLLDRGCFCDVTLACEGQLIRAHRVVLCACSTFFDTVLTNYASERDPIIIMKDVTFADVKSLIEFMYKGEINVEHANLASLLKTADDLKIKGLAEVSWRDDEDNGSSGGGVAPPPMPDTEFIIHSPPLPPSHRTHESYSAGLDARCSPIGDMERRNSSPTQGSKQQQLPSRLPMLTPIPSPSITIAAATGEHYLGPRRKRGRPPLDDAYDVFNVHKLSQLGGQLDSQRFLEEGRIHSSKNDEQRRHLTSAYQQHIHQQQRRQRQKLEQQHATDSEDAEDTQTDPEWITSNLEVNVSECDVETIEPLENSDESQSAEHREKKIDKTIPSPTGAREKTAEEKLKTEKSSPKVERFKKRSLLEKAKEHRQRENNEKQSGNAEKMPRNSDHEEDGEESTVLPQPVEDIESAQQVLQQQKQQQQQQTSSSAATTTTATPTTIASPSDLPSTSSSSHNDSQTKAITNSAHSNTHAHAAHHTHIPPAAHTHFTKYAPPEGGGYVLNEHGMLMTHDFQSHPVVSASNGNSDHEFIDIKMEDYDAADLRLTSEEMSQWQDVIKMDDYLAKGRRPQFWEEPFTRRVLDAIKNKRLEMKKAARILGVSYGTLYGRYREVYGCLKHPYSSTFRPPQSSQLAAVQPRFDIVWPSPKRDTGMLPAPLEIGKIRPKDLSELWARPQI